jgi:hypothetical protein
MGDVVVLRQMLPNQGNGKAVDNGRYTIEQASTAYYLSQAKKASMTTGSNCVPIPSRK